MLSTQIVDNLVNRAAFHRCKPRFTRLAFRSGVFYSSKKTHNFIDLAALCVYRQHYYAYDSRLERLFVLFTRAERQMQQRPA